MIPFILAGIALVALAGCSSSAQGVRENYPENPEPDDVLSHDPCSVQKEPEIVITHPEWNPDQRKSFEKVLQRDLNSVRKLNPLFLCGLKRIEILDQESFGKVDTNPDHAAHYSASERVIRIDQYSSFIFFHEMGHHLHNLGLMAPTVREFKEIGWAQDAFGKLKPKQGADDFFTLYASSSFQEDWAETFAAVNVAPLEVGLRVYLPPQLEPSPVLRKKLDLLYRDLHTSLRLETENARIEVGKSVVLPSSEIQLSREGRLYVQRSHAGWFSYDLSDPSKVEAVPELSKMDDRDLSLTQLQKAGPYWVMVNRNGYFDRTSWGSGTGLLVFNAENGKKMPTYSKGEVFLGDLFESEGKLRYFRRQEGSIELKEFDPSSGEAKILKKWPSPEGFVPFHVLRPQAGEYIVLGSSGDSSIQMYRFSDSSTSLKAGGRFEIPFGLGDSFLPPVRVGEKILIPLRSFHFLSYDLKRGQFSVMSPTLNRVPSEYKELKQIAVREGKTFAVGVGKDGSTLVTPISLQF
ncbi:MAG: hypothetical protein U1F57_03385 [bacterium]